MQENRFQIAFFRLVFDTLQMELLFIVIQQGLFEFQEIGNQNFPTRFCSAALLASIA